jgi:hypothetical protein
MNPSARVREHVGSCSILGVIDPRVQLKFSASATSRSPMLAPLLFVLLSPPSPPSPALMKQPPPDESSESVAASEAEGENASESEGPKPAESGREGPEFLLHVGAGAELIVGRFQAYGPSLRLGAWGSSWRNHFMIGGGAVVHYSYLVDKPNQDNLHYFTFGGDMAIGGGTYEKFAVYAHLTFGGGILAAKDGATNTSLLVPGIRAAAGVGGYGYITPRFSLGALVDFGYFGTLGLDVLLTANVHFGRGTKK